MMKLHSLRQGGLVGTKSGKTGHLTYGSSSKDHMMMMSIGASKTPAQPPNAVYNTTTTTNNKFKSLRVAIGITGVQSAGSKPRPPVTPVTEPMPMMEVPIFALTKKKSRAGFKGKMAQSIIRRGGLYGDSKMGGVGSIVYGSFEVGCHLQV